MALKYCIGIHVDALIYTTLKETFSLIPFSLYLTAHARIEHPRVQHNSKAISIYGTCLLIRTWHIYIYICVYMHHEIQNANSLWLENEYLVLLNNFLQLDS